ncbi:MAG: primosomal protein N' [Bacilli bacterium]|jgi:primosomal protein N' (replication factor Y)|nr:primosomal protein N' [Bacilli bacterium]
MVVDVLVEIKARQIVQTFTYLLPPELENIVMTGSRILVPFNNRNLEGFVLKKYQLQEQPQYVLKKVAQAVDEYPVLNKELLELGNYISKKTLCNLISAYQTMLPTALKAKSGTTISKKYESYIVLNKGIEVKSEKQQQIIDLVIKNKKVTKKECSNISTYALNTLLKQNVLKEIKEETYRLKEADHRETQRIKLNEEQQIVIKKVLQNKNIFSPFLLHGVTGSGKTEVYMNIIEEILKDQKEAIVLVPEISLTPQIVTLFRNRFGNKIAILHSRLSNGEKYDEWRKIERKEVSIVIGARSAIFAPFTNLGMIVIDEEHTETYKQENTPKYSAIDIALWRAKYHHCPVILGSATPSLESYTRAKSGIYKLLTLKTRISKHLPEVHLVDMKHEIRRGNRIFGEFLTQKINEALEKKEQIILLLNRRGFSTIMSCKACGYVEKCPNCDIPLVYHKSLNRLKCHYCNYTKYIMESCPECKSKEISTFGLGTERLEEETKLKFPNARIIRMDVDTTSKKGAHEKITEAFRNGEYDILIGTQMIAKGLDFPRVTVVGVMNGDASLNVPDFRSGERTFALLSQVAGRAGRKDLEGTVIIEGFNLDHYSILKAKNHDYEGFYEEEMKIRKKLSYPPYFNLGLIEIHGNNYVVCEEEANKIATYLKKAIGDKVILLGPSNAIMPKVNNIYYIQIILKFKKTIDIIETLKFIYEKYRTNQKVQVEIELNPIRL